MLTLSLKKLNFGIIINGAWTIITLVTKKWNSYGIMVLPAAVN